MNPAISSYRRLLRVIHSKFYGDQEMVTKAITTIRGRYKANQEETDLEIIDSHIQEAEEAALFIQDFVVQAAQNQEGNFHIKPTPAQVTSMQESFSMDHIDVENLNSKTRKDRR